MWSIPARFTDDKDELRIAHKRLRELCEVPPSKGALQPSPRTPIPAVATSPHPDPHSHHNPDPNSRRHPHRDPRPHQTLPKEAVVDASKPEVN